MKRHILVALVIALLAKPVVCSSSYLIQLKNGKAFVVSRYWEEAGEIKFDWHGGVITIARDSVSKITESSAANETEADAMGDKPEEEDMDRVAIIPFSKPADLQRQEDRPEETPGSEEKARTEPVDIEYYKAKRRRLMGELDKARESFWRASGDQDEKAKKKAVQHMAEISTQLSRLANELKQINQGELPDWWKGE